MFRIALDSLFLLDFLLKLRGLPIMKKTSILLISLCLTSLTLTSTALYASNSQSNCSETSTEVKRPQPASNDYREQDKKQQGSLSTSAKEQENNKTKNSSKK